MHFRSCGDSEIDKCEIIFQLAKELKREIFVVQGHEDLWSEKLSLFL